MEQNARPLTLGESRVGINFNPSKFPIVDEIKKRSAELIDLCEGMRAGANPDKQRLISIAQTDFEIAAMWAVKAATK